MAKPLTAPGVIRKAIEVGAVPAGASVLRTGGAYWEAGELAYRAWVWQDHAGMLQWVLWIGDAKCGARMAEFGAMSVGIEASCRTTCRSMPWPLRDDPTMTEVLREGLGQAGKFVRDRVDLCGLLSTLQDVHRGKF